MYKIVEIETITGLSIFITRLREDGLTDIFPIDEANADYQQYLIDTDGGLPLPKPKAKKTTPKDK